MDRLPSELILHIFQYLSSQELGTVSRVCSLWNALAEDDTLWHTLLLQDFASYLPALYLRERKWKAEYRRYCAQRGHFCRGIIAHELNIVDASGDVISAMEYYDDGYGTQQHVIIGCWNGNIRLFDVRSFSRSGLKRRDFSPLIHTTGRARDIHLTSVAAHNGWVWCIERVGDFMVSTGTDCCIHLWNVVSMAEGERRSNELVLRASIRDHSEAGLYVARFGESIGHVFCGGMLPHVKLWDVDRQLVVMEFDTASHRPLRGLRYAENLLVVGAGKQVAVFDMRSGGRECVTSWRTIHDCIYSLAFDSSSQEIATGGSDIDGTVAIWQLRQPDSPLLVNERLHAARVNAIQFDRDKIVSASDDKAVIVYHSWRNNPRQMKRFCIEPLWRQGWAKGMKYFETRLVVAHGGPQKNYTISVFDFEPHKDVEPTISHRSLGYKRKK